jgi:hypothetical protein
MSRWSAPERAAYRHQRVTNLRDQGRHREAFKAAVDDITAGMAQLAREQPDDADAIYAELTGWYLNLAARLAAVKPGEKVVPRELG